MSEHDDASENLACMEIWGGNHRMSSHVQLEGIQAWVYSNPHGKAAQGGDIHYVSSCATGRITRILLADVSGHGEQVASHSLELKRTMHRYINHISQENLVRDINRQFTQSTRQGRFATAVALTYFSPTGELTFCNAGHPSPLLYKASTSRWQYLEQAIDSGEPCTNLPFGILEQTEYQQSTVSLEPGDMILVYTDSLIDAKQNGCRIGLEGLLNLVSGLDGTQADVVVQQLAKLATPEASPDITGDDCCILLFSVTSKGKISLRQKLMAPWFMLKSLRSIFRAKERLPLPLPEWSLRNIGGFFINRLNKKSKK